mmetsp:Transcript_16447/g.36333  ORF Transcript_16447/g.36333 Transcript_16447/m.36333 type:complete len:266 (+) Transcript_16447:116-913(+)
MSTSIVLQLCLVLEVVQMLLPVNSLCRFPVPQVDEMALWNVGVSPSVTPNGWLVSIGASKVCHVIFADVIGWPVHRSWPITSFLHECSLASLILLLLLHQAINSWDVPAAFCCPVVGSCGDPVNHVLFWKYMLFPFTTWATRLDAQLRILLELVLLHFEVFVVVLPGGRLLAQWLFGRHILLSLQLHLLHLLGFLREGLGNKVSSAITSRATLLRLLVGEGLLHPQNPAGQVIRPTRRQRWTIRLSNHIADSQGALAQCRLVQGL